MGSSGGGAQNIVVYPKAGKRTPGCYPLRLPSATPFSSREPLPSDPHFHLEPTSMGRAPVLQETVAWRYFERGLDNSLKFRLRIKGRIRAGPGKEMLLEELRHGPKAPIEKEGSHDRFKSCGKQRGPLPAARLLALSQAEHGGESQVLGCPG